MSSLLQAGSHSPSLSRYTFASPPTSPLLGYSETDPFLASRSGVEPPPSPSSRFHPSSPSPYERSFSPGILEHLVLPPQAKRSRSKGTVLLGVVALTLVVVLGVQAVTTKPTLSSERVQVVAGKLRQSLEDLRDAWTGGGTIAESTGVENDGTLEGRPVISSSSEPDTPQSFNVSALPRFRLPSGDPTEKYIGFLPHSGFHNQRMELQNALLLGKLLNRTVLLPPVWIGWPTSTQHYDALAQTWTDIIGLNTDSFGFAPSSPNSYLDAPAHFPSTIPDFPFPTSAADDPALVSARLAAQEKNEERWHSLGWEVRSDGYPITNLTAAECKSYSAECRHTYKDTFLSWDMLVDLGKVEEEVKLVDRWDIRERAIEKLLNVTSDDVYVLSDRQAYDFKFTDKLADDAPLIVPSSEQNSHWSRLVSLRALARQPQRVVLVGSLFGSGRISTIDPRAAELREKLEQGLAFRNPWLLKPANEIRDRLGGSKGYVGVHARVGDGVFQSRAPQNMERAWRDLVERLGVDPEVAEEMWEKVNPVVEEEEPLPETRRIKKLAKRSPSFAERSLVPSLSSANLIEWSSVDNTELYHAKLDDSTQSPRQRRSILTADLAPFPRDLTALVCRAPLHTSEALAAFNTPLYLATDSRSPASDPNLAIFFASFPCTFTLADFDRPGELSDGLAVSSVGDMTKLVNGADGVALGRLFLPFLEAIVAAKGFETVGTFGSTFSEFAQGGLHDAYAADP